MADLATPNLPARDLAATAAFYSRVGFVSRGVTFEEVGIPHIEMVRSL
jgi:predicted GNAT family N-acyltransferase